MYKKNRQNLRKNKHKGRDIGAPWGRAQKMGSIGARQKMRNNNAPPQRGAKDGRQGGHERPFKQKMVGIGANPPIQKNGGQGRPPVVTPPSRKGLNEQQNIQQLEEVNVRKYREDGRRLFQGGQIGIKSDENDRALLGDGDYNDMFNDDDDDV
ncbi:MAG: hypothetical protein LBB09_03010, partial [Rickettsiales bacterium]|nr:hypothetical protein [Rickettsiales bacterium]